MSQTKAPRVHVTFGQSAGGSLNRDTLWLVTKRSDWRRQAMSRALLKLERRLLGDHYAACLREATVASVFS